MTERGRSRRKGQNKKIGCGGGRGIWLVVAAAVLIVLLIPVTVWAVGRGSRSQEIITEGEKQTGEAPAVSASGRENGAVSAVTGSGRQTGEAAPLLGGAELTMLQSQSKGQMMSFLLETKEGHLIVIDGGRWEDGEYLAEQIRNRGGHVSAWLLTHTHTDHVGALIQILQAAADGKDPGITVDHFYYNFADIDWYALHDEPEVGVAYTITELLKAQPADKLKVVGKGDVIQVDEVTITVLNDRYEPDADHLGDNDGNDAGLVYRAEVNGTSILFLGDLGETAGELLLADLGSEGLKSDMVQMAHHGQNGVGEAVYQAIDPSVCLWPTPQWLWDNEDGQFKTDETKAWIRKLHVKKHYCTKDGDQVIR